MTKEIRSEMKTLPVDLTDKELRALGKDVVRYTAAIAKHDGILQQAKEAHKKDVGLLKAKINAALHKIETEKENRVVDIKVSIDREANEVTVTRQDTGEVIDGPRPCKPEEQDLPMDPGSDDVTKGDPAHDVYSGETIDHPGEEFSYVEVTDELLERATKVILQTRRATASILVQRLFLDEELAMAVLGALENAGVVGPPVDSGSREILVAAGQPDHVDHSEQGPPEPEPEPDEQPVCDDPTELINCSNCEGTGLVGDEVCEKCEGTGQVPKPTIEFKKAEDLPEGPVVGEE